MCELPQGALGSFHLYLTTHHIKNEYDTWNLLTWYGVPDMSDDRGATWLVPEAAALWDRHLGRSVDSTSAHQRSSVF